MRAAFETLGREYPTRPIKNDGTFAGNRLISLVRDELVPSVRSTLGARAAHYIVKGSVGQGDWTHTPWLVLLDPAVTTTVENNYYVVYLLSLGGERLYLCLAQGCTTLKGAVGIPKSKGELKRRAAIMRGRVLPSATRLGELLMNLNVDSTVWRGNLYEAGCVLGVEYDPRNLPPELEMAADLSEALILYEVLKREGGWSAEDSLIEEAESDQIPNAGLPQAKIYRMHRTIERDRGHSTAVKKRQGTRCRGCGFEMSDVYGPAAVGMCDAHHLVPLHTLEAGATVTFDPVADFAVLCPSCHRAIHRLDDSSDLDALHAALQAGALSKLLNMRTAGP